MLLGKKDYDTRVDAWSLGCVMAEIIGGRPLFNNNFEMFHTPLAVGLRKLFPQETLSQDGFEVLSGLLEIDAKKRLTVAGPFLTFLGPWAKSNMEASSTNTCV